MYPDPSGKQPIAFHSYLTNASGAPLPIFRMTYGPEKCPQCPPIKPTAVLGVTHEDQRSETVQCLACDYVLTRPKKDPPGRKMNQSAGGDT